MPDLSDDIEDAAAEPLKASVDGQSVESRSLEELIAADKYLKATSASTATNSNGGARSGWGRTAPARFVPPGGGPE